MGSCCGKQPQSSSRQLQPLPRSSRQLHSPSNSLQFEEYYFGNITRVIAEYLLMKPFNKCGSFLIRESESYADELSLSVRGTGTVLHYRIFEDEIRGFYLEKRIFFTSLQGLVQFYSYHHRGLAVPLKSVCAVSPDYVNEYLCSPSPEDYDPNPIYDTVENVHCSYV